MNSTQVIVSFELQETKKPVISMHDFLSFFEHCGNLYVAEGAGTGQNRAVDAAKKAIDCFKNRSTLSEQTDELLESLNMMSSGKKEIMLNEAGRILVNISGAGAISLSEVQCVMCEIYGCASSTADIYYGIAEEEKIGESIRVTIIATDKESKIKDKK